MKSKLEGIACLTEREKQIVILVGNNKKYREIAEDLGLGYETVRTYVSSKFAVGLWGHQQGLIK